MSDFTAAMDQLKERESLLAVLKTEIEQKTSDRAVLAEEIDKFNAAERTLDQVRFGG